MLYCWGHNQYGQLADPSFFHRRLVADAPYLMQSISVASVGAQHVQHNDVVEIVIALFRIRPYLCNSISWPCQGPERETVLRRLTSR